MKINPECYNCFITQAIRSSRIHTQDNDRILKVTQSVVRTLVDLDHSLPPPIISEEVYSAIRKNLDVDDPYKDIKKKYNDIALGYAKMAKAKIRNAQDKLLCALKLSLAGNIIDFGGELDDFSIDETINDTIHSGFNINNIEQFRDELDRAKSLVLAADNAGEIVFDKILVETIKELYPKLDIYLFVRGGVIINDVTAEDARYVGFDKLARVIETKRAIPGFWPAFCEGECLDIYNKADIILSKGQGNFETLSEVSDSRIFFLFIIKCRVVAKFLNLKKFSKIFLKSYF